MNTSTNPSSPPTSLPSSLSPTPKIKILISIDLDAVAGHLGTGHTSSTNLADYSSGYFAANVGVPRLLKVLRKLGIADRVTWFVPGHSLESFQGVVKAVVRSGAELGLHGYAHEGAYQMTPEQERDVLEKCISLATTLTGKKPRGYRAPLYQLRETTMQLLEEHGFLYDASLTHHDCNPYLLPYPAPPPLSAPDFDPSTPASSWMHPLPPWTTGPNSLVEIPGNWHMEDMTPLQYLPHCPNAQGYVDVSVVEGMWRARFEFLKGELLDGDDMGRVGELDGRGEGEEEAGWPTDREWLIFLLILHPDTSGMAHVVGMVERFLKWLKEEQGDIVEFMTMGEVAEAFKLAKGQPGQG